MFTHGRRWFSAWYAANIICSLLIAAGAAILAPLPICVIGAGDDIGCARGFQTREGDQRPFRWSDDHADVLLTGVGWGGPQAISITLAAPRPQDVAQPRVTLSVAGLAVTLSAPAAPRRYTLLVPPPLPAANTQTLSISSETFVPPRDSRDLGVAIYEARALPTTAPRIPALLPLLALAIIGVALTRLLELPRQIASLLDRLLRYITPLLIVALLATLSVFMPMRVVPFLPGLAAILALAAWGLPRLGLDRLPYPIWVAAYAGAALDALLVANRVQGEWIVLILALQASLLIWGVSTALHHRIDIGSLLGVALLIRLLAFATRLLSGNAAVDPDTELFYNYGRATIELGVPIVEYPSGALIAWSLLALPASRELFALLMPLLNLACDLAIVWGIATIATSEKIAGHTSMMALALCYALTPLLLPFWHGKYDPLPTALLVIGLAFFANNRFGRFGWSGAALGLGGTIKWVPWLAVPIVGWQLFRVAISQQPAANKAVYIADRWAIVSFLFGLILAILATSLPFALRDWQAFLTPYTVQGSRPLIGESIWFLLAILFEPGLFSKLSAPWSGTESSVITPTITLAGQAFALVALGLAAMLRPIDQRRTLALAALAPATFLLLNRVYSPQYALPIAASLLIAGAAVLHSHRDLLILVIAITIMQAANLLIWPYTRSYWLIPSAVQFAAGIGAIIWLAIRATRSQESGVRSRTYLM